MNKVIKSGISRCPFLMSKLASQALPEAHLQMLQKQCPMKMAREKVKECLQNNKCESQCPFIQKELKIDQQLKADHVFFDNKVHKNYEHKFEFAINKVKEEKRYREFANIKRKVGHFPKAKYISKEGLEKEIVIWCSNDYLGMGQNPYVLKALTETGMRMGAGSGGTRNIGGNSDVHLQLENELADLHQKESGLIFSSCFVANQALLVGLSKVLEDVVYISDEKNHASLIEGMKNSRADKMIFRHNDMKDLENKLKSIDINRNKVIVFESVYSMSGTIADINRICELAQQYNALTFIDEVHAVGLYGNSGGGITEVQDNVHKIDFVSGTLSKGFGCYGGYLAGSKQSIDCIRSFAPNYIFTTSLPPPIVAAGLASVRYLKNNNSERLKLHERANIVKQKFRDNDIPVLENPSHIIPIFIGDPVKVKQASDYLLNEFGIYIQPINYPTVPKGREILRISPSPNHTDEMVDELINALNIAFQKFKIKKKSQVDDQILINYQDLQNGSIINYSQQQMSI